MRLTAPIVAGPILACLVLLAAAAQAQTPELRRVVLSTGGVGQFTFEATVEGAATVALDVPLDQVDDVLQSLRVDDRLPHVGVRLPGRAPLDEAFRGLPFGRDALASPQALLTALTGAEVEIPSANIRGRVLSVTEVQVPGGAGGPVTRHRLAIATATGLAGAILEETADLRFVSEETRRQVEAALAAVAQHRVQDRRRVEVSLADAGRRPVRLSYVVSVPVWKASYRLTLPSDGVAGPARLQGLAVIENYSGHAWRGVQVVLTSGNPVLYRQRLYEAYWTGRPEAPVDVPAQARPRVDQGAIAQLPVPQPAPAPMAPAARGLPGIAAGAPAPRDRVAETFSAPPPPPAAAAELQASVAFTLAAPVTADAGQSLMLPFLDVELPAQRVALYQPDVNRLHPLLAMDLPNRGEGALPPGLVTLFDRTAEGVATFVGNARMPTIPAGENRLLSFAIDLASRIDVETGAARSLAGARIARGVMELRWRERQTTTYRITSSRGARRLLVEQPRQPGWTIVQPSTDVSQTPSHDRIGTSVAAGQPGRLEVIRERPVGESVALLRSGTDVLLSWSGRGELEPRLRATLRDAAERRQAVDRAEQALRPLRDRVTVITQDQARLRENLARVPAGSDLAARYIRTLGEQEDEIADLRKRIEQAEADVARLQAAYAEWVGALSMD